MTHANVRASLPFLAIEGSRRGNGDLPCLSPPLALASPRDPPKLESLLTRQAWADV